MKNKQWLLSIGSSFILGAGAGWIAKGDFLHLLFTAYVPAMATLLAAYYGAKFAFEFQRNKEEEEIKNRNITSGNLTIFKLVSMLNTLLSYQKQIIQPYRGKPSAFLEMDPTVEQTKEDINIDIEKISFLLNTDDRNLLGEIAIERERFSSALTAINERSIVHRHEVQPLLESKGVVQGGNYSSTEIENILGNRLFVTLNQATDQVIYHVDSTIESIQDVAKRLSSTLKKEFPDTQIMEISVPSTTESVS